MRHWGEAWGWGRELLDAVSSGVLGFGSYWDPQEGSIARHFSQLASIYGLRQ
jgi:hypothetical protein